jgi:hypothetical protein
MKKYNYQILRNTEIVRNNVLQKVYTKVSKTVEYLIWIYCWKIINRNTIHNVLNTMVDHPKSFHYNHLQQYKNNL